MSHSAWDVKPLGELLRRPPAYGINAAASPFVPTAPTYIRITDISDDGLFKPSPKVSVRHPAASQYVLQDDDIVFARTGASVGKSYRYRRQDGVLVWAGFLIRITPDPNYLLPEFLAYYVQTQAYWDWIRVMSVRSGQPGVNGQEYAALPVPVPSKPEQESIVSVLRETDDFTYTLERLIEKKHRLRVGTAQQLLTGQTRLKGFVKPWVKYQLGDHVSYVKSVPLSRAQLDNQSPLRYLHYGDIHTSEDVRLAAAHLSMPRAPLSLAGGAGRLEVGDLVFADASEDTDGVGRSVEITSVPSDGVVPGLHTISARFDQSILADGFKAYLQFIPEFRSALLRLAAGTKVLATTRSYISSISLELPSVKEQRAISGVIKDADDEIDALEQRLIKVQQVKRGMIQELLSGRTRLAYGKEAA